MRKAVTMAMLNGRLRAAREKRGWTQAGVAEQLGTTNVAVNRWEAGTVTPSRYYREKLCTLYGVSAQELGLARESQDEGRAIPIFLFNEPLPEAGQLYGRQRERKTLLSRTSRRASTAVVGPRRIGKTWLLQHFLLTAPQLLGSHFRIGYLDGMSARCRTITGFTAEALTKLGLTPPEDVTGLEMLDEGLQELYTQQVVPVLCIDEFERLASREEFSLDFFEGLRAMTATSALVLITCSKSPLREVVDNRSQGSPFFNIFEQVTLKPFNYSDAEQFVFEKGNLAKFQHDERQYLWTYGRASENESAWWPIRLQLSGKILFEDLEQVQKNPSYTQSFEEQFNMIWQAVI
jgi:transcriptional regulator with XRE-family HTH domain